MAQPISMPWSAPVFPELPHRWKGVRMAAFPFAPRPGAVERILPPGMEPAEGMGLLTLLSYPQTDIIHPFEELVVMVPVRVDDTLGNYIPYIYVTTDEALIPGREIAGFPKKLAEVTWEREGDRFRGSATRWGKRILQVEGDSALCSRTRSASVDLLRKALLGSIRVGLGKRAVFSKSSVFKDLDALPEERLELSPGCPDGILNPARLPIPPLRLL